MKKPSDFKSKEDSKRQEILKQNREIIERYFNHDITSSKGGKIKIIGALDLQTKIDYTKFLEDWGWSVRFEETKESSWSMTAKSETTYNVTFIKVEPKSEY